MSTDDFHARMDKQDKVLSSIHDALVGNEALGHKGLVKRMENVESQVAEHNKKLFIATGVITGLSVALTYLEKKIFGGS